MEMIESLQNALLQPHNVNAAADGERRRIATSTALATALQHGALGPILVVVKTLLQAAQSQTIRDPSKNSTFSIDSGQHLDYLCQLNASDSIPLVHLQEYGQVKQAGDRQQILADTKRFHFAVPNRYLAPSINWGHVQLLCFKDTFTCMHLKEACSRLGRV